MSTKVKVKEDLSPVECKEHLDEVLETEQEVSRLERTMEASHKVFKEDKERFELKRDELLQYLKGLNEEHPLFDDSNTIDIPFPFPLPDGVHDATLANVAADPLVLGLSVSTVKGVRDKIAVATLGQLEKYLKADQPISPEQQAKAKQILGRELGPNGAMKLLRAVASFTGNRTKGKKAKGKEKPLEVHGLDEGKVKAAIDSAVKWRDTRVADLEKITPMQAQLLGQLEMATVGKVLDRFARILEKMPEGGPADFLKKNFATFCALPVNAAGKIIEAIYAFEEHQVAQEGS